MKRSTIGVIKQYAAGTSGALSVFIAGCCLGWPSPAVRKFLDHEANFNITQSQVSWIVALMDFGNILSPIPSGYMADSLGRKYTLLMTAFLYMATWLLTIFGNSAYYLFAARVGAGLGKGVAFTVVPMYLGEIAGVQVRGAISTIFTGLLYSGILFEYCIGPFLSYNMLNIVSAVVPIVFFLTFFMLPDSPYFLLMKERHKEARRSLAWFRNCDTTDEFLAKELDDMSKMVQKEMTEKGRWSDLVSSPGARKAVTIVLFLSAFQRFGGISPLLAYTAVTLPKTGGIINREYYMIIFGFTMVVGNFIGTPLMDRAGRKLLLIISCSLCAVLTGVSAVFYWYAAPDNDIPDYNWVPYLCFVTYGIAYGIGIGVIPSTFVGELFPTNIKSYASSVAAISFAVASFAINKFYLLVKTDFGVHYMYIFFTVCSISSVIFTVVFVFETKGKSFAEIQDKLNKRKPLPEPLMMK
ncbi:facilitated trehalose transporter Tret1-like [Macrosteles quadrilineatus]|uniref:facilitated trehalose transporter Tret1-like n=1 Tax=Macrosteles quadrilineatus TaxID=74068 RepID=UPI0023E0A924|nr:facilitated trehalose transporter Tret1-like [Macrosteles quadrilineatus]